MNLMYTYEKDQLENAGWVSKEVPYHAFGHTSRIGWTHPSKVFERPVNMWTAWEFHLRFTKHSSYLQETH